MGRAVNYLKNCTVDSVEYDDGMEWNGVELKTGDLRLRDVFIISA